MKYTRYDMKKRSNGNFVFGIVLVATLIFAFIIGTVISNIFIKNSNINKVPPKANSNVADVSKNTEKKIVKYIVVQNGKFKNAENIEQAKGKLAALGNPFTIQEQDGTRVLLGIYSEEEGLKAIKMLSDKGIENSKMVFDINAGSSPCDEEIAAIISNELSILTKMSDNEVKYIDIKDFKNWCSSEIKAADKNSKNIAVMNELKSHVDSLPNELKKDKVPETYVFLYNQLKKISGK